MENQNYTQIIESKVKEEEDKITIEVIQKDIVPNFKIGCTYGLTFVMDKTGVIIDTNGSLNGIKGAKCEESLEMLKSLIGCQINKGISEEIRKIFDCPQKSCIHVRNLLRVLVNVSYRWLQFFRVWEQEGEEVFRENVDSVMKNACYGFAEDDSEM